MLKTIGGIAAALVLMTSTAPAAERVARDPGLRPHEAQELGAQRRQAVRVHRNARIVHRSPRIYARAWNPGWYGSNYYGSYYGGPYGSAGYASPYWGYGPYGYGDSPRYWSQAQGWGSPYASYAYGGYGWGPSISFGRW